LFPFFLLVPSIEHHMVFEWIRNRYTVWFNKKTGKISSRRDVSGLEYSMEHSHRIYDSW
jgi:hypothetical protein